MTYYHEGDGMDDTTSARWITASLARLDKTNTPPWRDATADSERTAAMKREYKLAADPIKPGGPLTYRREILQVTDDDHREVFAVVADRDAIDVLEAIRRAYQDGREDNAPHWHSATGYEDTPCWCPSPLTHAPRGNGTYGSEETAR